MTIFHVIKYGNATPDLRDGCRGDIPPPVWLKMRVWQRKEWSNAYTQMEIQIFERLKMEKYKEFLLNYEGPL